MFVPVEKPLKPTLFWGALISLLIALAIGLAILNEKDRPDPYALRVIKQSEEIQRKSNINCANLKSELAQFLNQEFKSELSNRAGGKSWITAGENIKSIQDKLGKFQQALATCRSLYVLGQEGKLNNLAGLSYVNNIYEEMALLKVYYQVGAPQGCLENCLDHHFEEIKRAHKSVLMGIGTN